MNKRTFLLYIIVMLFFFLCITGCSKITKQNYDQISLGMDYNAVTDIIGVPDNCSETLGAKSCIWGNEKKNIKIQFLGDKVVLFSNTGIQ